MKVLVWLAAIAVGLVLYESGGEWFRDKATERACSRHAAQEGWTLRDWDGPGWHTGRMPGSCVFVQPGAGREITVDDRRIDRGRGYLPLVVTGSVISVGGIALTLMIGNRLTGALN